MIVKMNNIVKIKSKKEILALYEDKHIKEPGWNSSMDEFCGKIYKIANCNNNGWFTLVKNEDEDGKIANWWWHTDWLTILNYIKEFKDKDFII